MLQVIQTGLVGSMDGSASTLAPVFAAAFATHQTHNAFLVGMAASIGAGISMGFDEALADDGKLSGRRAAATRGRVRYDDDGRRRRVHTAVPDARFPAFGRVAGLVVMIELGTIAWIQFRFMETPPLAAAAEVMLGGMLVLTAGIFIGSG